MALGSDLRFQEVRWLPVENGDSRRQGGRQEASVGVAAGARTGSLGPSGSSRDVGTWGGGEAGAGARSSITAWAGSSVAGKTAVLCPHGEDGRRSGVGRGNHV